MRCHAKSKRTHEQCHAYAMRGKQVCRMHGGKSPGGPIKHGRYSKSLDTLAGKGLKDWYDYNNSDPEPLNLRYELNLLRAWLMGYQEKFAGQFHPKTLEVVQGFVRDIANVARQLNAIENGEKIQITAKEWEVYTTRVLEIVREHYGDDDRYVAFLAQVERLYSTPGSGAGKGTKQAET